MFLFPFKPRSRQDAFPPTLDQVLPEFQDSGSKKFTKKLECKPRFTFQWFVRYNMFVRRLDLYFKTIYQY